MASDVGLSAFDKLEAVNLTELLLNKDTSYAYADSHTLQQSARPSPYCSPPRRSLRMWLKPLARSVQISLSGFESFDLNGGSGLTDNMFAFAVYEDSCPGTYNIELRVSAHGTALATDLASATVI